ncbi:DUF3304 domain-containing protein [Massilia forsythiae]|uniref:DUF3304 domain-containing protein n=1 Tax=Massilia forsythiae TaxID=2728020 RepID=A0A7Z2VX62_9BURK|nr:DUF3304 domain-containing protein [Massilia forsythiae]QJE00764.1 DUF3304 domain-containing protein [Massilia forsythiae]
MKIIIPNFLRWYPILSLTLTIAFLGICTILYEYFKVEDNTVVSLSAIHHLGEEYRVNNFYIDKRISGEIMEGGEGGGLICCITIPKIWTPNLMVEIRWEVNRIIQTSDFIKKAEMEGIYRARVPIESYTEADHLWVHFFPHGRVRVVVSRFGPHAELHPIEWDDMQATRKATTGSISKELFTPEEIAEFRHEDSLNRKKYGDWR